MNWSLATLEKRVLWAGTFEIFSDLILLALGEFKAE